MPTRPQVYRPAGMPSPQQRRQAYDQRPDRQADKAFYSSAPWRVCRASFLAAHHLCSDCEKEGRVSEATEVDHIENRKERPDLAFNHDNLRGLCKSCHSRRTMRRINEMRR